MDTLSQTSTGSGMSDKGHDEGRTISIPSTGAQPPPQRSPSISSISRSSHRQSFAENLRNIPPSPRQRHASFTQSAVQDLLNHPPSGNKHPNPLFSGREWRDIVLGELVSQHDVNWISMDSSVEEATMLLLKSQPSVVMVRETSETKTALTTFDFKDLNAYLLVVVGLAKPEEDQVEASNNVVTKAQRGESISLREVQPLFRKESLVSLSSSSKLSQAVEVLGSGIHRVVVTNEGGEVIGIMSQLRVVEFFWDEGINFPSIDQLYPLVLRDLAIGTKETISVNSDSLLSEALVLMNDEGLTSVAVVDNGTNVVGNISTKDVRHLTNSSSAPLLHGSCMHFISVILNERGVEQGRDAFPVFYVNPYSTLAHTVAKLVATRSHRMWVVETPSPSPSAPATPLAGPPNFTSGHPPAVSGAPPSPAAAPAVPASAMAGARLSGRLTGVISLTDILNTFAKQTGLNPSDPGEQRARRRKSSSSSMRASIDLSSRGASIDLRR